MNRTLIFKSIDLLLLITCIIIPIIAIRTNNLWDEIDKMENCYFIGSGYIILSCTANRFMLDALYKSRARRPCEIAGMFFIVATLLLKFLIGYYHNGQFAIPYIMVMYAGFAWALLYLAATIREMITIIKYTRK